MTPGFHLALMEPPYNRNLIGSTLTHLGNSGALEKGAILAVEHAGQERIPAQLAGYTLKDQRKYGKTLVSFLVYDV
ncbi:MAG: RsmD family RNA methyltransferase [Deltaproteobacteria bacterium]|nr:RsmD family RNA methyltransferase [Deltaproteobacteria bacterium]